MISPFPCKDCPDRHPACHDKCEKYLEVKRARDEKKEADRTKNEATYYTALSVWHKKERNAKRRKAVAGIRKTSR